MSEGGTPDEPEKDMTLTADMLTLADCRFVSERTWNMKPDSSMIVRLSFGTVRLFGDGAIMVNGSTEIKPRDTWSRCHEVVR